MLVKSSFGDRDGRGRGGGRERGRRHRRGRRGVLSPFPRAELDALPGSATTTIVKCIWKNLPFNSVETNGWFRRHGDLRPRLGADVD